MDEKSCRSFLDRWGAVAFEDPREGHRHAKRGLALVEGLGRPAALHARALVIFGSACRAIGDLSQADWSYIRASQAYAKLGGDRKELVLDEADLWRRLSYLRTHQQRFPEALQLANNAIRVFCAAGESHQLGRSFAAKALAERNMADPTAVETLARALIHIDPAVGAQDHFAAVFNLVYALSHFQPEPELLESALAFLTESRLSKSSRRPSRQKALSRQLFGRRRLTAPDAMVRMLQGRILVLLEQHVEARPLLESALADLLELEMPFEAAAASLELADCLLRLSDPPRWARIERLARQALALLSPVPEAAETLGAWRLLERAAKARSLADARQRLENLRARSAVKSPR